MNLKSEIAPKGILFNYKDFVISGKDIIDYINNNERKSMPLSYFENNTYEIGIKYAPRLDYIKIVDKLINEHNN